MKHIFPFLTVMAGLAVVSGCKFSSKSVFSRYSSGNFPVQTNITARGDIPGGLNLVDVLNQFGKVKVIGTDEPVGTWSWALTVRAASQEDAGQAVLAASCPADKLEDRFRIAVSLPDSHGDWAYESEIEVRVPKAMAARVENHFGGIEVGDLTGAVQVSGQNGAVELRNIGGEVTASTSFGPMTAIRIGAAVLKNQNGKIDVADVQGTLEASTSFASLTARHISGSANLRNQNGRVDLDGAASAEIRTSFAGLSVNGVAGGVLLVNQNGKVAVTKVGGPLDARTSFASMDISGEGPSFACHNQNGAIRLDVASGSVSNIVASTSFGEILVRLPGELKPTIQAQTEFAEINSDFPVLMKPKGSDPFKDVDSGTLRIQLDTRNAPIRIAKK
jgi:DUF4097 and DUF4098 domain-containing protein YvlB